MRSSRQARQQQDTDFTHGIHLERGKHEVARGGGELEKEGETGARSRLPRKTLRTYKRRFKRDQSGALIITTTSLFL